MKSLIVTCDDCGLSEGINVAALELHRKGIAGSASVMANFPATAHALELFRANPGFSVGVHLNLTDGFPLTPIPAEVGLTLKEGRFRPAANLTRRALFASAETRSYIEEELIAQIEVVARAGFAPQHLTAHLQFHLLPHLREIVDRLARAYRVPWVRPHSVRATVVPWNPLLARGPATPGRGHGGAEVLRTSARRLGSSGPDAPGAVAAPEYMAVLRQWQAHEPDALMRMLKSLSGTVELVVHPGVAEDPMFPAYVSYGPRGRFAETQFLERCWPLIQHLGAGRW